MIKKYLCYTMVVASLFFSCKSKKMNEKDTPQIIFQNQNITKELPSPDKTKLLILSYLEDMNATTDFEYKVISYKTKKELISGKFTGIKMEWFNNESIKCYLYQGMIEKENPQENFKIINIK